MTTSLQNIYFLTKPIIPRSLQNKLRRMVMRRILPSVSTVWPILDRAGQKPNNWLGWPESKQFALVLTHDVESEKGLAKCLQLAELEARLGFRSCFNFVPEKYFVPPELRQELVRRGFEVGVHGLCHDGRDFWNERVFKQRAIQINQYLKDWNCVGFRAPYMIRNLSWIRQLNIEYDMSTFDTDPFEPQPEGVQTVFPFLVDGDSHHKGYVELPYTLPQDSTLFIYLGEKNIDIWKHKVDWLVAKGGMALLDTHPDYIDFNNRPSCKRVYPVLYYEHFLEYCRTQYQDSYWQALPRDVARFYSERQES